MDHIGSPRALSFGVLGWSAWTRTLTTPNDWRDWADKGAQSGPVGLGHMPSSDLPMMLRRRATPVGRTALGAAMSLPLVEDARYILSSRYGELDRTASILSSLIEKEPVSPADFSMSVHHGLVGLLSIALKNTRGHGAVAGGAESFCYGLLEAAACIADRPDEPVILIHYDECPESAFVAQVDDQTRAGPVVVAVCLSGQAGDEGLSMEMRAGPRGDGPSTSSHILDFLRFVLTDARSSTSHGDRLSWEWSRA
jgi:hypothetical protein